MSSPSAFRLGFGSTTNNSLFKVGLFAAGLLLGLYFGANNPDVVLPSSSTRPPSKKPAPSDEADAPLCAGPECAAEPPPRLPSTALALAPPSPYESSRLSAIRASASSSATVGDLEMYALLLHLLHAKGEGAGGALYADPQESTPALLAHLTSHAYDVSISSSSLTLSSLRALASSNALALARVQVGGEGRWLAVVAVDAFYVYAVDVYTPAALVYVPTREFSRYWWEMDADGKRQTSVAMIVTPPQGRAGGARSDSSGAQPRAMLVQLKLDNAPQEHPAVEIASL